MNKYQFMRHYFPSLNSVRVRCDNTRKYCIIIMMVIFSLTLFSESNAKKKNPLLNNKSFLEKNEKKEKKKSTDRNLCYECHSDPKIALRFRKPGIEWKESVHNSISCTDCHGGNHNVSLSKQAKSDKYDFVAKPGGKNISLFCGQIDCHRTAYVRFAYSKHSESQGKISCTTCHGVHNIKKSSKHVMKSDSCKSCHSVEYATEIINSVFETEKKFNNVQNDINFLIGKNVDAGELITKMNSTKDIFFQLVHFADKNFMEFSKRIIDLELKALRDEVKKRIAMLKRIDLLYLLTLITIIIIIVVFLSYFFRNIIRRRRKFRKSEVPG